ncbi:MAG: Asp23/Gls24 family envelope stress response protein [Anaerolineae bacterium]|nr:Asp23/Gls24 family envelope stress response protein [Anaerolineae bacterium]NIN94060.1 Asp23/Gls24 family envelope stress response protein [Anaerolineae bacterium]NIQ77101.1 Asp23/Gls24 family envelope stress response protein [Anaerolineae bacterium]
MEEKLGRVTIAPQVLLTIARLTALSTPGVASMARTLAGNVGRLLRRQRLSEGMGIRVEDDVVFLDLHIIVEPNVNLLELGRQIQHDIARAINDMLGMHVGEVNIHIEDVVAPPAEKEPEKEAE